MKWEQLEIIVIRETRADNTRLPGIFRIIKNSKLIEEFTVDARDIDDKIRSLKERYIAAGWGFVEPTPTQITEPSRRQMKVTQSLKFSRAID